MPQRQQTAAAWPRSPQQEHSGRAQSCHPCRPLVLPQSSCGLLGSSAQVQGVTNFYKKPFVHGYFFGEHRPKVITFPPSGPSASRRTIFPTGHGFWSACQLSSPSSSRPNRQACRSKSPSKPGPSVLHSLLPWLRGECETVPSGFLPPSKVTCPSGKHAVP